MADINSNMYKSEPAEARRYHRNDEDQDITDDEMLAFAELLFFAYREFISEPDSILMEYGFGRAHHRVLHFVWRHPGMRVADLLDILNITKQSLARVLKQLVDDGFVLQMEGQSDRRERRLYLTDRGHELAKKLARFQQRRIYKALAVTGTEGRAIVKKFLINMIAEEDRFRVIDLIQAHDLQKDDSKAETEGGNDL